MAEVLDWARRALFTGSRVTSPIDSLGAVTALVAVAVGFVVDLTGDPDRSMSVADATAPVLVEGALACFLLA